MQQRHPKLTKENFPFRTKEKSTTTHIPQTEHFSFQSMLYVHHNFGGPHRPAKAKVINHTILSYYLKTPTTFQFFQNQSDWSPEQPGNSTRHYSNFKTSKNIFSEYRETRFWLKSNRPPRQGKLYSHHKKPLKVINSCPLGARQILQSW